jgi:membrane protein DedA with SNARE-associated domain
MMFLRAIGSLLSSVALAACCWAMLYGTALAQAGVGPTPPPDQGDTSSGYALPYALVLMCVILGLLVTLRASNRRDREKPEEYQSMELLKED